MAGHLFHHLLPVTAALLAVLGIGLATLLAVPASPSSILHHGCRIVKLPGRSKREGASRVVSLQALDSPLYLPWVQGEACEKSTQLQPGRGAQSALLPVPSLLSSEAARQLVPVPKQLKKGSPVPKRVQPMHSPKPLGCRLPVGPRQPMVANNQDCCRYRIEHPETVGRWQPMIQGARADTPRVQGLRDRA